MDDTLYELHPGFPMWARLFFFFSKFGTTPPGGWLPLSETPLYPPINPLHFPKGIPWLHSQGTKLSLGEPLQYRRKVQRFP